MINIYTLYNKITYSSELIILFGLLEELPQEEPHCYNQNNISRYSNIIDFCKSHFNYIKSPNNCDIIVLPYKFISTDDFYFKFLNNISIKLNKPLLCFYNDDNPTTFNISSNVKFYRTSLFDYSKLFNEFSLPTISPDFFQNYYLNTPELTIGYCGHLESGRHKYIDFLHKSSIKTDFIIRNGFWAPGLDKKKAQIEYYNNIHNNLFTFCYKGGGNFSYRFYETLMMGRIPLLINTHCVFPLSDKFNIESIALVINEDKLDFNNLITIIQNYYNNNLHNLLNIQQNNRYIWETYLSPQGFLNNII